jgi:hypothetical protein
VRFLPDRRFQCGKVFRKQFVRHFGVHKFAEMLYCH